jgi:hypothetical protein
MHLTIGRIHWLHLRPVFGSLLKAIVERRPIRLNRHSRDMTNQLYKIDIAVENNDIISCVGTV